MTPPTFNRPCLNCGTLTRHGTRCLTCEQANDQAYEAQRVTPERTAYKRSMYGREYQRRRRIVLATATGCANNCGHPITPTNPLQADHVRAGDPTSPLQALCRKCNIAKGNRTDT